MQPLKITAVLSSPFAGDAPHLDSILCYAVTGKRGLPRPQHRCDPCPGYPRIPIYRKEIGGVQIPCCSSPIVAPVLVYFERIAKRISAEHAEMLHPNRRLKVQLGGGFLKSYHRPIRLQLEDRVVWFAVGRGRVLRRVLREVQSIGVKRSIGFGIVREWIVECVDEDFSWFAPCDAGKILMRPLPLESIPDGVTGAARGFGAVRWPYWHPENFVERIIPQ